MTNKAYIVANEQQEREVLHKFELKGYVWFGEGEKPTEWVPSHIEHLVEFPYALLDDGELSWCYMSQLDNQKIVYDGRKESKIKISKKVYDALVEWKDEHDTEIEISLTKLIGPHEVAYLSSIVGNWWLDLNISNDESNNRLIAIIRWVNGEDVFEVEKQKKWIVRSKKVGDNNRHSYVRLVISSSELTNATVEFDYEWATYFDTREEAESWANAHQEVIEVEA